MNNALLYVGAFLVLVLASLFAGPAMIDWNGYRGVFEEEASKVLGRDVRVSGNVNVRLLPSPYVRFEQVRLADTSGQTGEPFIRADSFTMRLAGPPLLRGVLEARDVELEKPVLNLAIAEDGRGNWQDLSLVSGSLPFVPSDVTLRSVRIIDGTISLFRPKVGLAASVTAIGGELSADSLRGPFRFQGNAKWAGIDRTIRIGTGEIDGKGSFPLKAKVDTADKDFSVLLDAVFQSIAEQPSLTGKIEGEQHIRAATSDDDTNPQESPVLEFKSAVRADLAAIAFDKIELSLARSAVPQIMSGSARVDWTGNPKTSIKLTAKWFDIDRLVGAGQGGAPFGRLKTAAVAALASMSGDTDAEASIDLDQVRLGGESAGGLRIDVARRDGMTRIREFRAGLPGGSRIGLSGLIRQHAGEPIFQGEGFVHGTSFSRLKAWAERSGADIDVNSDGPFAVEGQLLVGGNRFELTDASATIAGQPMTGDVKIIDDERYRAEITLESAQLPPGVLFPETFGALDDEIRRALGLAPAAGTVAVTKKAADDDNETSRQTAAPIADTRGAAMDINLRVLAGKLKYAGRTLTNVDATINLEDGNIRIPAARATTVGGLTLSAEGHLKGTNEASTGFLAFDADAPQKDALEELAALLSLNDEIGEDRIASWQNGRMAGSVRFGARAPGTADVALDGHLGPARVNASAEFDEGLNAWRTAPSRIRIAADGASLERFLAGLGQGGRFAAPVNPVAGRSQAARIQIAAAGILGQDTRIKGLIESDPLTLGFEGAAAWPEDKPVVVTGQSHVDSDNARHVLALAGVEAPAGLSGTAINGDIALTRSDDGWRFAARRLMIGASTVDVKGSLGRGSDGVGALDADVKVERVWLASLLAALRDRSSLSADGQGAEEAARVMRVPIWPDDALARNLFGAGKGRIALAFDAFEIEPGLATGKGNAVLRYEPGHVTIDEFKAESLGGEASAKLRVAIVPGGSEVNVEAALRNGDVANISKRASGRFGFEMNAGGKGATLQSAMRFASGKGKLSLAEVTTPRPASDVVTDAVSDVLSEMVENRYEPLMASISSQLMATGRTIGSRQIEIAVNDGTAKLQPMTFKSKAGATSAETKLDLVSLNVDSVWKLEATPPAYAPDELPDDWQPEQYDGKLPPLVARYQGPLWAVGRLPAMLDGNALHRELIILQTERSAQELTRLRLLDEQRGAEQAARIEALRREAEEKRRAAIEAQRIAEQEAEERARREAEEGQETLPPILPESYNSDGSTSSIAPGEGAVEGARTDAVGNAANEAAPTEDQATAEQPPQEEPQQATPKRRTKPRVRAERRTTADEIMRSLGGYP